MQASAQLVVTVEESGPVSCPAGYGIEFFKGTTLTREKVILNDVSCPVNINDYQIKTRYNERQFEYYNEGNFASTGAISAYELHTHLYDVFGQHQRLLVSTRVEDCQQDFIHQAGTWRTTSNDAMVYLTAVSYMAKVRTADGKIWTCDYQGIAKKLSELSIEFQEEYNTKTEE
jgi:hypothetical protein